MACTATRHGTAWAYQRNRCRCPQAREQWRLYNKRRREGRAPVLLFDPTGTIRRIQALMAIGHTSRTIGDAAGMNSAQVCAIPRRRGKVTAATVTAIRAAYDQLSMQPGTSDRTRRRAAAANWPPPLAWDDDTIDDPAAEPDRRKVDHLVGGVDHAAVVRAVGGDAAAARTQADRFEALRQLVAFGLDDQVVAARLDMSVDAVKRAKQRHREHIKQAA